MNHIPAVHLHTVVNALHERSCAMVRKAQHADEIARIAGESETAESYLVRVDAEAQARAYRKIGEEASAAFDSIMRNAPVVEGYHRCGVYKVKAAD